MPHKDKAEGRAWRRGWWAALPASKKRQMAESANARIIRVRRWLDAFKLKAGCVDCGYRVHHAALHFDHVRGKKSLNVCNSKSIRQAQREIKKCEVRCANCHAVKTFKFYEPVPGLHSGGY